MITFEDLEFKDRRYGNIKQALMYFENGYGISVICGDGTYCSNDGSNYEVAVMKGSKVAFDTPITDDVLTYQTPEQITEVMKKIRALT